MPVPAFPPSLPPSVRAAGDLARDPLGTPCRPPRAPPASPWDSPPPRSRVGSAFPSRRRPGDVFPASPATPPPHPRLLPGSRRVVPSRELAPRRTPRGRARRPPARPGGLSSGVWAARRCCILGGRPATGNPARGRWSRCREPPGGRFYIVPCLWSFGDLREGCDSAAGPEAEFREPGDAGGDCPGGAQAWAPAAVA